MLGPSGSHLAYFVAEFQQLITALKPPNPIPQYNFMIMRRQEKVMLYTAHHVPQFPCLSTVRHSPSCHLFPPAALPCHPHPTPLPPLFAQGALELPLGTSSLHLHTLDPSQQGLCLGFTILGEQLRTQIMKDTPCHRSFSLLSF